ncbi:hypothetical protein DID76_03755 [Candidatus Marinamargulisbacteria bacterium SCGC AG-414-C22]|nr:hypothetical protein DID76_03755 [Candidatus Marinamargulisbacteria bacterium SCGC AG-414-C22]
MKEKQWFGIIGTNGSGKSTVCSLFAAAGFEVVSLSRVVRDYVESLGLPQTREHLIKHANLLKDQHGITYFADVCLDRIKEKAYDRVVFDSIRHPLEVSLLKKQGVKMIGVDVAVEIRYQRIQDRLSETDHVDFDTFVALDKLERSGESSGQSLDKAFGMCDMIIDNNKGEAALKLEIEDIIYQGVD